MTWNHRFSVKLANRTSCVHHQNSMHYKQSKALPGNQQDSIKEVTDKRSEYESTLLQRTSLFLAQTSLYIFWVCET